MGRPIRGFSNSQKYQILQQAETEVRCRHCKEWVILDKIEFDHIVALVHKGANDPSNGQPLCETCHKKKLQLTLRVTQKLSASLEREKVHGRRENEK